MDNLNKELVKLKYLLNKHKTPTPLIPKSRCTSKAIFDSGASNHYFQIKAPLQNKERTLLGPSVTLPDGNTMKATHSTSLQLPQLSPNGNLVHLFPQLKSANLISIGQLCDDGCMVVFHKDLVLVAKHNNLVLKGTRNHNNGMWEIPLPLQEKLPHILHDNDTSIHYIDKHNQQFANGIIKKETTINDLINFLHAACFSPSPSTWIEAIRRNYFLSWPGLTAKAVRKYLTPSPATAKGHLDQSQKNQQSSKLDPFHIPPEINDNIKHHVVAAAVIPISTGKIYTDQTGRFPVTSATNNKYIFVLYDHDSNAILAEPLKNRKGQTLIDAFLKLTNLLKSRGMQPKFQILDNEASVELKKAITTQNIKFQLAPPNIHRRNAAERAIRTFKNHFIAGLASVDPDFPLHQWDQLIDQAVITLNLLRPARLNPALSAYAYLFGMFNYAATPLAPPGIKCQIHEKPNQRQSWGPHSIDGHYLGPALDHYRCFKVHATKTNRQRITDTVAFIPTKLRMPQTTAIEKATTAAQDLISILQKPTPASPFLELGNEQTTALQKLADIFHKSLPQQPISTNDDSTFPRVDATTTPPDQQTSAPRVQRTQSHSQQPRSCTSNPSTTTNQQPLRRSPRLQQRQRRSLLVNMVHNPKYKDFTTNFVQKQVKLLLAQPVLDPNTGKYLEYRDLLKHPDEKFRKLWIEAMCKELGRLAQGYKNGEATNCIEFIHPSQIPSNKKPTYARIVAELREQKADPHRIRITVGGNLIYYPHDKSQPTADLNTVKLHINSTISTPNARYACLDIKNMYLNSTMQDPEFMFLDVKMVPQEFINEYNLQDKIHNGKIYVQINKGMYGLPQAGKLAYDQLKNHLEKYGYTPCKRTTGLWKHHTRPISFTLVVDDFGVKYVGKEHLDHLISALRDAYEITVDMKGSYMLGMTLKWDYINRHVDISMPNYINKMIQKFFHPKPKRHQAQPHQWFPPQYGQKTQYAHEPAPSPSLSSKDTTRIQQIVGTLLYYARAVDPTMLPAINDISSQQSKPTETTASHLCQLLDYAASNPDATIRYTASGMVLHIHSDGSYLSAPCSRSRAAGHFFLSSWPQDITKPDNPPPKGNGPIFTVCKTLRTVMASAAETELGSLFYNCQEAVPLRQALIDMGHPQPPTPIATDNSTAHGIVTSSIKQKRSKAMDMRFHWVTDRVQQQQFFVYWAPGKENLADYFSKHHPPYHHTNMRKNISYTIL